MATKKQTKSRPKSRGLQPARSHKHAERSPARDERWLHSLRRHWRSAGDATRRMVLLHLANAMRVERTHEPANPSGAQAIPLEFEHLTLALGGLGYSLKEGGDLLLQVISRYDALCVTAAAQRLHAQLIQFNEPPAPAYVQRFEPVEDAT